MFSYDIQSSFFLPRDENLAPTDPKYFIGLGLSSDLPKYLRYKGKIPNRHISRRDLRALIRDTWEQKAVYDALPARKGQISTVCINADGAV